MGLPGEGEEIPNVFALENRLFLSIMPLEELGGQGDNGFFVGGPTAKCMAVRQVIFSGSVSISYPVRFLKVVTVPIQPVPPPPNFVV